MRVKRRTMDRHIHITVVNNINFYSCSKVVNIINKYKNDIYLFCGGIGECLECLDVVDKGYGVVNLYDDRYVIDMLKHKKMFVSGKWFRIDSICISGIDAKNPTQAISRIVSCIPGNCSIYVILSLYTPSISRCSRVVFKDRHVAIGLPEKTSKEIMTLLGSSPVLFIVCSEHLAEVCLEKIKDNFIIIAIPKNICLLRLEFDIQNLSLKLIDYVISS